MLAIAITNYSIAVGVYLFPEHIRPEGLYSQFSHPETFGVGIFSLFLFNYIIICFSYNVVLREDIISSINEKVLNFVYNPIVAYGSVLAFVFIFFSTYSFGNNGIRGGGTALTEYRIIILLLGLYYSGKRRYLKVLWTCVIFITSIIILFDGNRVNAIPPIIALIVIFYNNLINYKTILKCFPIMLFASVFIGVFRNDFVFGFEVIQRALDKILLEKFTIDTAIYAYIPSLSIIELKNIVPVSETYSMLFAHIERTFSIVSSGASEQDLIIFSKEYFTHWNGCVSPCYFYFFFSYLGIVLFSLIVVCFSKWYQKYMCQKASNVLDIVKLICSWYFVVNVFRWYIYGPMYLIRNMCVCFVATIIVLVMDNVLLKKYTIKT